MEIKEIQISGFGKWSHQLFSVEQTLHLFCGANESGKSTLYQFIRTMLFGFSRKRVNQRNFEPKDSSLFGGKMVLEHEVYGKVTIERFKSVQNGKATLYLTDGQIGDEALLKKVLFPLTETLFDEIFSFRPEDLFQVQGLQEEKLQELLVAIGLTGSKKIMSLRNQYNQEIQNLYKPNGRNPVINQKIQEYQVLQETIRQKESQEKEYQTLLSTIKQVEESQTCIQEERQTRAQKKQILAEKIQKWPLYEEWLEKKQVVQHQPAGLAPTKIQQLEQAYQEEQYLSQEERRLIEAETHSEKPMSTSYLFYRQHEEACQSLLAQQSKVTEALSKKRIYEQQQNEQVELTQALAHKYQWPKQWHPDLMIEPKEIGLMEQIMTEQEQIQQQKQQHVEKVAEFEKNVQQLEYEVQQLEQEQNHHRLIDSPVFMAIGVGGGLLTIGLYSVVMHVFMLLILGVLLLLGGGYAFYSSKQKKQYDKVLKAKWQQKLGEMDWMKAQEEMAKIDYEKVEKSAQFNQQKLAAINRRYQVNLNGENNWQVVLAQRSRWQHAWQVIQELADQLESCQKILAQYRENAVFLADWLPITTLDDAQLLEQVQKFIQEKMHEHLAMSEHQTVLQVTHSLKNIQKRREEISASLQQLLKEAGLKQISQIPEFLQNSQSRLQIRERMNTLEILLTPVFDLAIEEEKREVTYNHEEEMHKQELLRQDFEENLQQLQALYYQKQQMEQDGSLTQLYQKQEMLKNELERHVQRWEKSKLAETFIQELFEQLATQKFELLLKQVSKYFAYFTLGEYSECLFEKEQVEVERKDGQRFLLKDLSTGTRNQLYLAFRLGFIRMHLQECRFPVIIDDGWVHYDQKRKQAFFDVLVELSQHTQVICFSSDKEIVQYTQKHHFCLTEL